MLFPKLWVFLGVKVTSCCGLFLVKRIDLYHIVPFRCPGAPLMLD